MAFDFNSFGAPMTEQPKPKKQGILSSLTSGIKSAFEGRVDTASDEIVRAQQGEISPQRAALRTGGQAAAFAFDVPFEAAKAVAPAPVKEAAKSVIEKVAGTGIAQTIAGKYNQFKERSPEAAKDVEAIFNIGGLIPVAGITGKVAAKTTEKIAQKTGAAVEASRAARIETAAQELDATIGKIVQGKPGDIPKAAQALRQVDTTGVKTYSELGERIDDKVELLSTQLDEFLEAQGGTLTKDKLRTVTEVGDEVIEQNFVDDAVTQLKELYTGTKDAPSLAKITQLGNKLETEGLTRKELNDLAREYGVEFGSKAFNKIGDPLTSVNAQAFENTRKGIKSAVRNVTEGDAPKLIDSQLSALLRTRPLVSKMEEKVNALYQRVQQRGLLERAARGVADVVNIATFNTVSGFISRLLPSNVGLKVLNSIELEKNLQKNLKKVDDIMKAKDDATVIQGLQELIRDSAAGLSRPVEVPEAVKGMQPGLSTKSVISPDVLEQLKDKMLADLQKPNPKANLNMALETDKDDFIEFLQDAKNPTYQDIVRGLELLKLDGKDTTLFSEALSSTNPTEYLRDKLGRYAGSKKL